MKYLIIIGVLLIIKEQLLLGELIAFSMYVAKLYGAISSFTSLCWQWQRCKPSFKRYIDVMKTSDEDSENCCELKNIEKGLSVNQITIHLSQTEILRNISIKLPIGKVMAIIGLNGSGKTTLLKILSGLLTIDDGEILVDEIDLAKIKKRSYRNFCGIVFQHILFPNKTIRNIISYRNNDINDEYIYKALDAVGLKNFVLNLPRRLDSPVGEMGNNISGGELHRLAIAREIIYKPKLLFLDEAFGSVDCSKHKILELLKNMSKAYKMSIIFVTHDYRLLKYADVIYDIDENKEKPLAFYQSDKEDTFRSSTEKPVANLLNNSTHFILPVE